jgi:uncharacterized repeat protein (TIGR03803 family)
VLYNFCSQPNCSDGGDPQSSLTFDSAGNLYGTTYGGGAFGAGTVFELSPNGNGGWNETVLYSFTGGADGANPTYSYVMFDSVGNLYGTAANGGVNGYGVAFELSPASASWTETVLYSFANDGDGANPMNGLIFDPAGNLYGTNSAGVFELSPSGGSWTEQVIYGASNTNGLTMHAGNIFGIITNQQIVFELSPNGNGGWNPTAIFTFDFEDGWFPVGIPVLDQAGNLYGATSAGGTGNHGEGNFGTVYRVRPIRTGKKKVVWSERVIHNFWDIRSGESPSAGVVLDAAGNVYCTTLWGGKHEVGTVFELAAVGKGGYKFKILWSFNQLDGWLPEASLILDSAGNLYGTTVAGGSSGYGVVFEVTP